MGGPETKTCTKCSTERPLSDFAWDKRWKRHESWCRMCRRTLRQEWGARNAAEIVATGRERRAETRRAVFEHYGTSCACCGEDRLPFLSLDHVDGGGTQHRSSLGNSGRGISFYRWIIRQGFPTGYRTLCHNCNTALGLYGYCPHVRDGPPRVERRGCQHDGCPFLARPGERFCGKHLQPVTTCLRGHEKTPGKACRTCERDRSRRATPTQRAHRAKLRRERYAAARRAADGAA